LVTSQRERVTAVDPDACSLTARMDDGRIHTLRPDQIGADQLALGHATTVHRSQGATFDTAHLYADAAAESSAMSP
jgi:ATP-dependent exoDNAse (exonuclease V) alpha subunit